MEQTRRAVARQNTIHDGLMVAIQVMMAERIEYINNMLKFIYYSVRRGVVQRMDINAFGWEEFLPGRIGDQVGGTRMQIRREFLYYSGFFRPTRRYLPGS